MCERIAKDMRFDGKITPARFRTTVLTDIYDKTKILNVFDINDHIVWYQDDRQECIMPLSWEQDLLSDDEIEEILEIFSEKAQFNELYNDDDY